MRNQTHNSRKRSAADARFSPHRDEAIAALKEDLLTFEEIRVKCCATNRHIRQLAEELGIDIKERGKRVLANTRRSVTIESLNLQLLREHLDDLDLSYKAITEAHKINYKMLREVCKHLGIDYDKRKAASEKRIKSKNTGKKKGDDIVIRMEMIEQSLSRDGMSLQWLRKPWCHPVLTKSKEECIDRGERP